MAGGGGGGGVGCEGRGTLMCVMFCDVIDVGRCRPGQCIMILRLYRKIMIMIICALDLDLRDSGQEGVRRLRPLPFNLVAQPNRSHDFAPTIAPRRSTCSWALLAAGRPCTPPARASSPPCTPPRPRAPAPRRSCYAAAKAVSAEPEVSKSDVTMDLSGWCERRAWLTRPVLPARARHSSAWVE